MQERRDYHNPSVDPRLAEDGLCGHTHLPSGRRCRLQVRHAGGCEFGDPPPDHNPEPVGAGPARQDHH